MQILFVHGNYPAQFGWIAEALARTVQHEVRFLTARQEAANYRRCTRPQIWRSARNCWGWMRACASRRATQRATVRCGLPVRPARWQPGSDGCAGQAKELAALLRGVRCSRATPALVARVQADLIEAFPPLP